MSGTRLPAALHLFGSIATAWVLGCASSSRARPEPPPPVAVTPAPAEPEAAAIEASAAPTAQEACEQGDARSCLAHADNVEEIDKAYQSTETEEVLPIEGANVSISSIDVDGLSATDLQCRREGGGGLFGGAMGAISGIAKRKAKLMKCASAPEDVRVRWGSSKGKINAVEVKASSPKVESCVNKAVSGATAAFGGTCAATFSIGG